MATSGAQAQPFIGISICIVLFGQMAMSNKTFDGPEHELYEDLFDGYLPDSRPVKNASHTVLLTFALSLNQLLDLDEKNQVLTTSVWIFEEWKDELLTWSPSDYQGQLNIMIPATSIWLPDIFIFNTAGDGREGFVKVNGSKVAIRHDGHVRWMVPLMVSSMCAVDVTYFPYDRQTCTIKFGSWIYDTRQLDIILDTTEPDLEHYVMNSEYDLENVFISRGILNSSCCPGDGSHSIVELKLSLKRKSLYYDYIVIAPTIMLCVLTLASFLLPCDRGEKMAIGLTVFLTLYVLQLRIADNVPDTNSTPILGVFMLIVMTFNCVSLIMAAIVMNIKKRGDDVTCPEVPKWLFSVAHHVFGRIVCTRFLWADDIDIPPTNTLTGHNQQNSSHHVDNQSDKRTIYDQADPTHNLFSHENLEMKQRKLRRTNGEETGTVKKADGIAGSKCKVWDELTERKEEETSLLSPDLVDDYVCRQSQQAQDNQHIDPAYIMKRRWFYVAEVVDKFSFLVYLVLLTTSIFTVLFLIPVYFRNDD